jgi:glycosyltransferase involved in cell wall biosynthesis
MILLDLDYCQAGYTPTHFQHSLFPDSYRAKIRVLHDGIDTDFWQPYEVPDRAIGGFRPAPETRVVTYVSRGLESMRGFDIFMRVAKRICERRRDVIFLVVGEDRVAYGGDLERTGGRSFKEHVLAQDDYDPERIRFTGRVAPDVLARILSISDLHIYLTVPFVLSWSLLDAMACGCTVLGSDTEPVRELIQQGQNGLLGDFFDVDELTELALEVLAEPRKYRAHLGAAARRTIEDGYSVRVTMPRMAAFYEEVAAPA